MAVSLDEVNFLILKYLQESGFEHTAYVFETESFLQSTVLNKTHVPPGALITVLQRSLSYLNLQKSIQRAKKDPNDPVHEIIEHIEKEFPPIEPQQQIAQTRDSDVIASSAIQHPYAQKSENSEPVPISPSVASILTGHPQTVYCCGWCRNGEYFVTAGGDGVAIIWSIAASGQPTENTRIQIKFKAQDTDHDFSSLDISSDCQLIALGCFDRCVYLFDKTGKQLSCFENHKLPIFGVKFNPSGKRLVSVSADRTAIVWATDGLTPYQIFDLHTDAILCVQWLNDNVFVTGGADGIIIQYDLSLGSTMMMKGHTGKVNTIAFSKGGILASASEDKTIRIWNEDGSCKHILQEHTDVISDIKWKPDSDRILASGSCDGSVLIWDTQESKKLSSTENSDGEVMVIEFSPSGDFIASGDDNGHVIISRVVDASVYASYAGTSAVYDLKWDPSNQHVAVCFDDSTVAIIHIPS